LLEKKKVLGIGLAAGDNPMEEICFKRTNLDLNSVPALGRPLYVLHVNFDGNTLNRY